MLINDPVKTDPQESPNLQSREHPEIAIFLKKSSVVKTIPSPLIKYLIAIGYVNPIFKTKLGSHPRGRAFTIIESFVKVIAAANPAGLTIHS